MSGPPPSKKARVSIQVRTEEENDEVYLGPCFSRLSNERFSTDTFALVNFRSLPPPSPEDTYHIYRHESTIPRYQKRRLLRLENEQVVNQFSNFNQQVPDDASDLTNCQYPIRSRISHLLVR